jgi:LacI family transcriptional regulator
MSLSSPPTLREVARLADVSVATASRVLNGGSRTPSAESTARVLAAAARLNYRPNAAARAVARGRTDVIGLILHDIADPYFSSIATSVLSAAARGGLTTTVAETRNDPGREADLLALLHQQRVRGVIIAGSRTRDRHREATLLREAAALAEVGGRVVMISESVPGLCSVTMRNAAGAEALARELAALGHRDFAVLSGPAATRTSADRVRGFRRGLAQCGVPLPAERVFSAGFHRDGGHGAALAWLDSGIGASCLFAVNDVMAIGAIAALRSRGLDVPRDVSVAGFGGFPVFDDFVPALTTVAIPIAQLGDEAVRLLLDDQAPAAGVARSFTGTVMLRASTRRL